VSYRLNYSDEARRALRLIESLADAPRPPTAQELRDLPNRYRLWLNGWRIIYRVDDDAQAVFILAVRHKTGPETYESLE
jgi:mRNA-degrading endonuclease RelE of RelBE toxin-antitoxin system